jgi:ABC-type transport system involved in multi-copper enzyme maturation permease subunit
VITGLIRKELRQLLPLLVALGALQLWGILDEFILKSPDTYNWELFSWLSASEEGTYLAYGDLIVGIFIAYTLLPGEHDQKTIEFLYTLPIRRRTLFLVKYAIGVGLLMLVGVSETLEVMLRHALNPGSLERGFLRPAQIGLSLAANLLLPFVFIAYGILLSFFRRLGWVLFMLIGLALELAERIHPSLRILSVKALYRVEHQGTRPLIHWRAWQLHAGMAAIALFLAARLWLQRQEAFAAFYDKLKNGRKVLRIGIALVVVAIVVTAIGVAARKSRSDAATSADGPAADTKPVRERTLTFETQRFHFTYASRDAREAMIVARAADQAHARVRGWLGAPEVGRIVADLTDQSNEHLGIAGWQKMRLDIRPPKSPSLLMHVLYHETTHVFAAALSHGEPDQRRTESRFFAEGLAEYVAYELLDDRRVDRAQARQMAALAKSRFHLRFEDLVAPTAFVQRHDEYLLYAFGEVWVAALVDTCGPQAPARVLRRFGGAGVPQTLAGVDLWRQSLQLDGCDLDQVVGAFEQQFKRLDRDSGALPIATGGFVAQQGEGEGQRLIFQVTVKAPTNGPFPVTVRVRSDADATPGEIRMHTVPVSANGGRQRVSVPAPDHLGQHLEFQIGAAARPDDRPFFTRWESTTLAP